MHSLMHEDMVVFLDYSMGQSPDKIAIPIPIRVFRIL